MVQAKAWRHFETSFTGEVKRLEARYSCATSRTGEDSVEFQLYIICLHCSFKSLATLKWRKIRRIDSHAEPNLGQYRRQKDFDSFGFSTVDVSDSFMGTMTT